MKMNDNRLIMKNSILLAFLAVFALQAHSQVTERERPIEWEALVRGGRFMDRLLPMHGHEQGGHHWGYEGVQQRFTDNGIEDNIWSYWGGNIRQGEDGLYHTFVAAWLEASPKGHMTWSDSYIIHATSENSYGPFKPLRVIGKGHNPEFYQTQDGTWVIYAIGRRYTSRTLYGEWSVDTFTFDPRDRRIIEGLSNVTFARRSDNSYLAVCRGGGIWISKDGVDTLHQISDRRVYPNVQGRFEDPVVWRDNVQYHLIVNDWLGRIAWYLRSPDGVQWVTDPGEAYKPGIARHPDGTDEDWFKYERAKVLQDEYGRAIQMNFAVIDTIKKNDLPYDNHSSKNICLPLQRQLLMRVERMSGLRTKHLTEGTIEVRVISEPGFDAQSDLDIQTLRFGANEEVNYGRGSSVLSTYNEGRDIILVFNAKDAMLTADEFAPKLLGRMRNGDLAYGYTRVPYYKYETAILSTLRPVMAEGHLKLHVTNYGVASSTKTRVKVDVRKDDAWMTAAQGTVKPLSPYESTDLLLKVPYDFNLAASLRVTFGQRTEQFPGLK